LDFSLDTTTASQAAVAQAQQEARDVEQTGRRCKETGSNSGFSERLFDFEPSQSLTGSVSDDFLAKEAERSKYKWIDTFKL